MIIDNYKFQIYLEGYLIPGVIQFTISEANNGIPQAGIVIAGNNKSLKILAGTIVQIFAHRTGQSDGDALTDDYFLIYEGEVNYVAYSYNSEQGDTVTLNSHSLLSQFYSSRLRPANSLVTKQEENASSLPNSYIYIRNKDFKLSSAKVKNSKEYEKKHSTLNFSSYAGLISPLLDKQSINFANALGPNTSGDKGNFFPFMKAVNYMFTQSDILYAINSKSFNLFDSIFIFPNPSLPYFFQLKTTLQAIKDVNSIGKLKFGDDKIFSIAQFFAEFNQRFYYRYISPAAPTAGNLFYSEIEKFKTVDTSPIRQYYIPGIESGPPALCNTIFPEEVITINFSRNLYNELTRLVTIGSLDTVVKGLPKYLLPVTASPEFDVFQEDPKDPNSKIYTGFTDEELYRGVNLKRNYLDAVLNKALVEEMKKTNNGKKVLPTQEEAIKDIKSDKDGISTSLQVTSNRYYIVSKFASRTMSVIVDWNPNYVVGLPGMVFKEGMPTFVGMVEKVEHRCSASSGVTTSIEFSGVRIIFDEEDTEKTEPIKNPLSDSLVLNETDNAIYGGLPYMYNEKLYSFDNMGSFLYNYIMTGKINKKLFEKVDLPGGNKYWTEFLNINNSTFKENNEKDYSILRWVKNDDNSVIKNSILDIIKKYKEDNKLNKVPSEIRNGIILKEAIIEFKKLYKKAQTIKEIRSNNSSEFFRQNLKQRNLITKNDYLNFIGGSNPEKIGHIAQDDTKDAIKIFKNKLGGDLEFLKKYISNIEAPELSKAKLQEVKNKINKLKTRKKEILIKLARERNAPLVSPDLRNQLNVSETYQELLDKNRQIDKEIKQNEKALDELIKEVEKFSKEKDKGADSILSLLRPYNRTRKAHVVEAFKDFVAAFDLMIKEI